MVNWLDYGIAGCIIFSGAIGLFRGFVRESISMITWIGALILGIVYCEPVASLFTSISVQGIRFLLSFTLIVLVILIIGGIFNFILTRLIAATGLGTTDRLIGMIFGVVRGGVIIAAAVLLVDFPFFHQWKELPQWKESRLIPPFHAIAHWLEEMLPPDFLDKIKH